MVEDETDFGIPRKNQMAQKARVVVSIDLSDTPTPQETTFAYDTVALLDEVGIPATWSTPSPTLAQMAPMINGRVRHEIALLATDTWATRTDRTQFASSLSNRIATAAANGISIHTLAAPAQSIEGRLDLLVKHRLTTFRTLDRAVKHGGELDRYGVNLAPESIDLHGEYAWWTGGPRAAVRRGLHNSIQNRDIAHIAISVKQVVQAERQQIACAALEDAANRVRYGLAQVVTMSQLASGHRIIRTGTGRSILRAA